MDIACSLYKVLDQVLESIYGLRTYITSGGAHFDFIVELVRCLDTIICCFFAQYLHARLYVPLIYL
jgi:hypothetical protein